MTRFTAVPIRSARSPVSSVETLTYELLPGLGNARVIRREKERVQSRGSWTLHLANKIQPLVRDPGLFLVDGDEIAPHPGMRDVVLLGIEACVTSAIPDLLEFDHNLIPRRGTNVLEDDDGRAMIFNPSQHTAECATRFSIRRYILFLIVQVRVVDARSSGHEHINVSWN